MVREDYKLNQEALRDLMSFFISLREKFAASKGLSGNGFWDTGFWGNGFWDTWDTGLSGKGFWGTWGKGLEGLEGIWGRERWGFTGGAGFEAGSINNSSSFDCAVEEREVNPLFLDIAIFSNTISNYD